MIKQKEYYQLCYSNDKINTGCEKPLQYKHENLDAIYNLGYALKWECVIRRRAFSDRHVRKTNKEIPLSKSCKNISYPTSYGFTDLPVLQMNSSYRKSFPPKISSNPKIDFTGVKLVSSLSCDSSDACSDCKLSQSKISQTNLSSSIKPVCSCNKYHLSSTLSKFLIQSCNNSKKTYYGDFGEGKVCTVLNSNSQSASIQFKRLNQNSWNSSKKSTLKSKRKFKRQYSYPNSPFLSALHRSRSLPPPRLQCLVKSVDDSNRITRLEQPSPFVRTIYQYLDDEEAFMLECGSTDSIQVHSSGLMKLFQDRKSKLKLKSDKVAITRTIQCDTVLTGAFYSGRRVSENSSCIISTLASISRERKLSSLNYQDDLYIQTPIQQLLPQNKKTVSCEKLEYVLKNAECGMLDPQHHEDETNKHSVSNKLSNYFDILATNVKSKKGSVIPYISISCDKHNSISSFSKKEKFPKKLKHTTLMLFLQSRKKFSKNISNGKSIEKEVNSIYDIETKKEIFNKNSLNYPNDEQLSNMFLKRKSILPQPSFNYAKVFKNKQDKVNKCDSTMSNGSLNNTNKIKDNLAEKLDVFNNNINSLNQRLKNDVDSFTAKDFLSLSQQKKISDQRSCLQLDKTINEGHDLTSVDLIQCNSMNEKAKSNSKKELSKDDLELKKSRAGSFIGKIKKKYMGSRSCDFEYLKGNIDKSSGHSEEKFIRRHGDIRYHSEVIIEEESKNPLKISGNWKWRKDSKEKDTKSTSLESRLETSKESKFSTILSVFEQENLPADPTKIKSIQKISNLKQKGLEKKSVVTELKKKVSPNTPKKYSVPSFLSTFSPLRARKHSNNIILQKSAEELDATICAREKELKELKAQQKQNRPVLVDETKPRSVSANGDYKPTTHFKKSMKEDENFEFASQTRSYFQTTESYLKKSVSSPSLLSKSSTPFEQQRIFNYSDFKPSFSHAITDSLQQSNNLPNKEDHRDALCENYSDNNLSLKYSLTNATSSNCICKGTLANFDSRLLNESYMNYLKSPESYQSFSTNGRNIFGEVAKKYEGSPITKERIKHLEQSFIPPASIKQKTVVDMIKCSHGQIGPSSKIAMIIPFMKDASKTFDDSKQHSSNSQNVLKRSNTMGKLWKIVEGKWTVESVENTIESNISYGRASKHMSGTETKNQSKIKKYTTLNHLDFQNSDDSSNFKDIKVDIKPSIEEDVLKYGSLDRRLFSQKKRNGVVNGFFNEGLVDYKLPTNQLISPKSKECAVDQEKPVLNRWRNGNEGIGKAKVTNCKQNILTKNQPQKFQYNQSSINRISPPNGFHANANVEKKFTIIVSDQAFNCLKNNKIKKTNILADKAHNTLHKQQSSQFLNLEHTTKKSFNDKWELEKTSKLNHAASLVKDELLCDSADKLKCEKGSDDKNIYNCNSIDISYMDKCILLNKSNRQKIDNTLILNYLEDNKLPLSQLDMNNNNTAVLEIKPIEITKKRSNSCPVQIEFQETHTLNNEAQQKYFVHKTSSYMTISNLDSVHDPFDKFDMENNFALKTKDNKSKDKKAAENFQACKKQTKTQRSHSTGHSPDIKLMLQHLICDIEEEEYISSEEESVKKSDTATINSYDNFNRNLEEILRLQNIKKEEAESPLRRTFSDDDMGIKLLRKQRLIRKKIASGEMGLKRKPSVIWAKVKNMEVTLVVDCDYQKFMQLKIESFEVRRVNTHKDIEELAIDTFIKHLQLLDKDALDLSSQDIKHLQLHSHEIPIGSAFDISNLNIIDNFLPCYLHLNDKFCWSLAAVAYDALIPKSFLEKYVSLIFSHNNVVFYGPSGTGKSYLARRLSHLVAHRVQKNSLPVIFSNITPEKWQKIIIDISNDTCDTPKVYVLDGFTQSFFNSNIDISDILTLCQSMNPKSFVICTITQGLSDTIPSSWQQSFRWIWLPNHEEPIDCLLQRYLRRKFIQYGNFHLQREFFRIVDWLASVWRHINSIIERFSSSEHTIGPTMFYPCPTDILNAEEWFVDLWNYSVCPYFIQTVRHGIKKYGERANEWTDPLEWILKTYPWSYEKSKLKFIKIRMEDVGYKETSQLSETTLSETERLMGFLRQLELLMNDGELTDLPPFAKTISTFAGGIAEKY